MFEDNKDQVVESTNKESSASTNEVKEEKMEGNTDNKQSFRRGDYERRRPWKAHKESDIKDEVVTTSRISKTTKGGKQLRFNTILVAGDGKGRVGFATAKAKETIDAIEKAKRRAHKSLVTIPLTKNGTITHDVVGIAGSTKVQLRPAKTGKGIVAGGPVRIIMQLAGVENISTKIHGPKTKLNAIRATFNAFEQLETREQVQERRMIDVNWLKPEKKRRMGRLYSSRKNYNRNRKQSVGGTKHGNRTS